MGSLKYRGRTPDSDYAMLAKSYADSAYATLSADNDFITATTVAATAPLVSTTYVDSQDALRAHIADVDAADANYVLATQLGVNSGVAQLGSDGYVPSGNLPTLPTERVPFIHTYDTCYLSDAHTVTTVGAKVYKVATMTIPDPGWPYVPLAFVVIRGGGDPITGRADRTMTAGSRGQISVYDSHNVRQAWTVTTARERYDYQVCTPYGDDATNPTSYPPVTGTVTYDAWLGLWTGGTTYTFSAGDGFSFYVIGFPAIT